MDVVSALRTFLRVAQTRSFSAAAIDLNLTQPAVSRQVSALEAHLKTRLLHRTTSALALTAEGEQMLPMALRVVEAVEALSEASGAEGATVSGKVRLSLPAPLGLSISDRLARLLDDHPSLAVELILREEASDLVALERMVRRTEPRNEEVNVDHAWASREGRSRRSPPGQPLRRPISRGSRRRRSPDPPVVARSE